MWLKGEKEVFKNTLKSEYTTILKVISVFGGILVGAVIGNLILPYILPSITLLNGYVVLMIVMVATGFYVTFKYADPRQKNMGIVHVLLWSFMTLLPVFFAVGITQGEQAHLQSNAYALWEPFPNFTLVIWAIANILNIIIIPIIISYQKSKRSKT